MLPVAAGLRRGRVEGEVEVEPREAGCRVSLAVTAVVYRLNWLTVMVLALGAAGALVLLLWPLFPPLLELAPLAALVALASWLLVAARLRSSSPQDYLEDLAAELARD